ncbi:MAG: single-strand selective monofunctional uracil DNA glycosylase [Verrucomicrobiales bacterium]
MSISTKLLAATDELCAQLDGLTFAEPVTHVYNPLVYARAPHEAYVRRFGNSKKKVMMLGMNPGPWGMAQTGVPFGEIPAVRDWMGINEPVSKPPDEHPKRPIEGFDCARSEVSGRRLWGLFSERFGKPESFFKKHFALNYCPLVFMEESGKNRTPDKLPASEIQSIQNACDAYVGSTIEALQPEWLVGVGAYAEAALKRISKAIGYESKLGKVLHPSPASPAANRGWSEAATRQLLEQGIWTD